MKGIKINKRYVQKRDWINEIIIGSIMLLVAVLILTLVILRSEGAKCVANPIKFNADSLAKANGDNVYCKCQNLNGATKSLDY
jgi:hypothetical protein